MCLLSISTGNFLLIAFVALCIYELGVFLYFKFVKGSESQLSKNELRKRKEVSSDKPVHRQVVHSPAKGNGSRKIDDSNWEDLIDYRKSNRPAPNAVPPEVYSTPVIDAYSPADTHADFLHLDKTHRSSVEDLLGNTSFSATDKVTGTELPMEGKSMTFGEACRQEGFENIEVSQTYEGVKDSSSELKNTFSEMDFSNMMN